MQEKTNLEEKKCTVIHLPLSLLEKFERHREKSGKNKSEAWIEVVKKGLEDRY